MKDKILILLPSRSNGNRREENVDRFIQFWKTYTDGFSDLCVLLDYDDEHRYKRHDGVIYSINPNMRFVPKLNKAALTYKDSYKYIANFSDDFVIRTNWEKTFIEFFKSNSNVGIAYGNDLLQGELLPTAVCMTSNIIDRLGYMIPNFLKHMYADNFWIDIGRSTNTIKYYPEIVFEHLHPDNGKSIRDAQYEYAAIVANEDKTNYYNYLNSNSFLEDISKINNLKKQNETSII
jgi:hypothetical protein